MAEIDEEQNMEEYVDEDLESVLPPPPPPVEVVEPTKTQMADEKFPRYAGRRHKNINTCTDIFLVKRKIRETERTLMALHDSIGSMAGIFTYDQDGTIIDSSASLDASGHYFLSSNEVIKKEVQKVMNENVLASCAREGAPSTSLPADGISALSLPLLRQLTRDMKSRNNNKYPPGVILKSKEAVGSLSRERCREVLNGLFKIGQKPFKGLDVLVNGGANVMEGCPGDGIDAESLPPILRHKIKGTVHGSQIPKNLERSRQLGLTYKRQKLDEKSKRELGDGEQGEGEQGDEYQPEFEADYQTSEFQNNNYLNEEQGAEAEDNDLVMNADEEALGEGGGTLAESEARLQAEIDRTIEAALI